LGGLQESEEGAVRSLAPEGIIRCGGSGVRRSGCGKNLRSGLSGAERYEEAQSE